MSTSERPIHIWSATCLSEKCTVMSRPHSHRSVSSKSHKSAWALNRAQKFCTGSSCACLLARNVTFAIRSLSDLTARCFMAAITVASVSWSSSGCACTRVASRSTLVVAALVVFLQSRSHQRSISTNFQRTSTPWPSLLR